MRVILNTDNNHNFKEPVAIALGTFDGIHLGHQALIKELTRTQTKYNCATMIYTFLEHPLKLLMPDIAPPLILDIRQKILQFHHLKLDYLVLNRFTPSFASTEPEVFVEDFLLKNYNIHTLIVGYNYRFGKQGKGDIHLLKNMGKRLGFDVIVVPPVYYGDEVISSSLIRDLIQKGDIEKARIYLGYPYTISGRVIHGYGRGKLLGFPTANISYNPEKVIPKFGVYVTSCSFGKNEFWGVTNVGRNPTFSQEGVYIETHLLDVNCSIYGEHLKISFFRKLRSERKFLNVEDLKKQVFSDIDDAKNFIYKLKSV